MIAQWWVRRSSISTSWSLAMWTQGSPPPLATLFTSVEASTRGPLKSLRRKLQRYSSPNMIFWRMKNCFCPNNESQRGLKQHWTPLTFNVWTKTLRQIVSFLAKFGSIKLNTKFPGKMAQLCLPFHFHFCTTHILWSGMPYTNTSEVIQIVT